MEQRTASQQQEEPGATSASAADQGAVTSQRRPLTEDESRVLECLQKAANGLTTRQLEARSSCGGEALERALSGLAERKLVARLNTIIPSYAARSVSVPIDGR